jgi:hypothetical protein
MQITDTTIALHHTTQQLGSSFVAASSAAVFPSSAAALVFASAYEKERIMNHSSVLE